MITNEKPVQYMTSAELEAAIRRHREHTKKLLAEVRSRRSNSLRTDTMQSAEIPRQTSPKK